VAKATDGKDHLPNGPNGAVQVITVSGKTACDVWPDHVDCIVAFDNPQPPSKSGPANAVTMTLSGQITSMQADWGARPGDTELRHHLHSSPLSTIRGPARDVSNSVGQLMRAFKAASTRR
jgi:hypothetical protein